MTLKFDSILKAIEENKHEYAQSVEDKAHLEGQKLFDSLVSDAKERLKGRTKRYEEEAALLKKREFGRHDAKVRHEISEFKHELVHELLNACLEYYVNLSDEAFFELLQNALKERNGNIRPRIHVDPKRYPYVLDQIGKQYQIIEDQEIEHGFVLNFRDFDVNYEFVKVFQYYQDQTVRQAMKLLFGAM